MNWPETELGPLRCEISINFTPNAECSRNENLILLKIGFKKFCCGRMGQRDQLNSRTGVRWNMKGTCIHRIRDGLSLLEKKMYVIGQSERIYPVSDR